MLSLPMFVHLLLNKQEGKHFPDILDLSWTEKIDVSTPCRLGWNFPTLKASFFFLPEILVFPAAAAASGCCCFSLMIIWTWWTSFDHTRTEVIKATRICSTTSWGTVHQRQSNLALHCGYYFNRLYLFEIITIGSTSWFTRYFQLQKLLQMWSWRDV